mmetsp:Transcript_21469/g.47132  ORF Transcript_21469/g.47132 Transcript_21469/m.47132 type:complete len:210 (-) Transcript_21469:493-1122(-)
MAGNNVMALTLDQARKPRHHLPPASGCQQHGWRHSVPQKQSVSRIRQGHQQDILRPYLRQLVHHRRRLLLLHQRLQRAPPVLTQAENRRGPLARGDLLTGLQVFMLDVVLDEEKLVGSKVSLDTLLKELDEAGVGSGAGVGAVDEDGLGLEDFADDFEASCPHGGAGLDQVDHCVCQPQRAGHLHRPRHVFDSGASGTRGVELVEKIPC